MGEVQVELTETEPRVSLSVSSASAFSHKENSMESFLNEIQVSEKIQVSLACLRRWRLRGEGPQYVKVGPLVRYRPEAIEQWVDALPTGGNGRKPRSVQAGRNRLARTA